MSARRRTTCWALISANPGDPALCLSLSQPQDVMAGTPTCGPFGESGVYTTPSGRTIDGTRGPFSSQFAAITYQKTIGNSDYNALEVSLRHTGPSLELLLGYTYGKSIDLSSSLAEAVNPLNPELSRAPSAFDMRQNFVASYDWKLPFTQRFRGRRGWADGWSLSGTTRFGTGFPVTLFNNDDTSLLGTIPNGINNDGVRYPRLHSRQLERQYQSPQRKAGVQYLLVPPSESGPDRNRRPAFLLRPGNRELGCGAAQGGSAHGIALSGTAA